MPHSTTKILSAAGLLGLLLCAVALALLPGSVRGYETVNYPSYYAGVYGDTICTNSPNAEEPMVVEIENLLTGEVVATREFWISNNVQQCWDYPFPEGEWRVSFEQAASGDHSEFSQVIDFSRIPDKVTSSSKEDPYLSINRNEICPFSPNIETPIVVSIEDRAHGGQVVATKKLWSEGNPECWTYPFPVGLWRVVVHQDATADYPAYNDSQNVTRAVKIKTQFRGWYVRGGKVFIKIKSDPARVGQVTRLYVESRKVKCSGSGYGLFCDSDQSRPVKKAIKFQVSGGVQRITVGRVPKRLTEILIKLRRDQFVKGGVPYASDLLTRSKSFGTLKYGGQTITST